MKKNIIVNKKKYTGVQTITAQNADDTSVYDSFVNTEDGTATAADITKGKTAYVNGELITGTSEASTLVIPGPLTAIAKMIEKMTMVAEVPFTEVGSAFNNEVHIPNSDTWQNYFLVLADNDGAIFMCPTGAKVTSSSAPALNVPIFLIDSAFNLHSSSEIRSIGTAGEEYATYKYRVYASGSTACERMKNLPTNGGVMRTYKLGVAE